MKPTWKNTLRSNNMGNSIEVIAEFCISLGYDYMIWNDRIYRVFVSMKDTADEKVEWNDTNLTIFDIEEVKQSENVVIACRGADGYPVMIVFEIEYTEEEYDDGVHYDKAIKLAKNAGYECPFICFDINEQSEIITMAKILDC